MNENLDLRKILKDCPRNTKFYSSFFGDVYFSHITNDEYCINLVTLSGSRYSLTKEGKYNSDCNGECIIFPSRDQRDWSKWQRPFVDGDIVYNRLQKRICIYHHRKENEIPHISHCRYNKYYKTFELLNNDICIVKQDYRFATEEEKQLLFDAIKANGYKWNSKTKTLEKLIVPKFKISDKIRHKSHIIKENIITEIKDTHYILDDESALPFINQDNYELLPNKFDLKTLKPFDKVLVRTHSNNNWFATFFSHINYPATFCYKFATTSGLTYKYMIPYNEETKHLLGTNNQAPEFYIY